MKLFYHRSSRIMLVIKTIIGQVIFTSLLAISGKFDLQIENPPAPPDNYHHGRISPYDNVRSPSRRSSPRKPTSANLHFFIGEYTNIDDLLDTTTTTTTNQRNSPVLCRSRREGRLEEGKLRRGFKKSRVL